MSKIKLLTIKWKVYPHAYINYILPIHTDMWTYINKLYETHKSSLWKIISLNPFSTYSMYSVEKCKMKLQHKNCCRAWNGTFSLYGSSLLLYIFFVWVSVDLLLTIPSFRTIKIIHRHACCYLKLLHKINGKLQQHKKKCIHNSICEHFSYVYFCGGFKHIHFCGMQCTTCKQLCLIYFVS